MMERLPIAVVPVVVVALALDFHLEELLDTLMHGGIHGCLTPVLCCLPPHVLVVYDQVTVAISAVGVGESIAGRGNLRLVPSFEQAVGVRLEHPIFVNQRNDFLPWQFQV